jgi:abequosyltransferase
VLSKIVLSIVIPTYNRAELLRCLLESIVRDFDIWPNDLELIVSDNASPDETSAVVSEFIQLGFPIKYFANETNIGPDGNFAACFNLPSGKYFWLIGDDEIMYRGTVQYVLELCRAKEFGMLHLTSRGFSRGQQAEVSLREIPKGVVAEALNSKKLFRLSNVFLTFISANVINREAVLNRFPDFDAKAEFNTNLPQLAWTYSALIATDVHYYVRTPLFGALGGNTSGYKLIEVFGVNLINITRKYLRGVIPNAERIMSNAVVTGLLPGEFMSQCRNSERKNKFGDENIVEAARICFQGNLYFQIFVRPIFSDSNLKRRVASFLVRAFNRTNRLLGYVLL